MNRATLEDFSRWLNQMSEQMSSANIHEVSASRDSDGYGKLVVKIYTETNCYAIRAIYEPEHDSLGCVVSSRRQVPGEHWFRYLTLTEGPLHVDTWYSILGDIVSHELIEIENNKENNDERSEDNAVDYRYTI